SLRLVSRPPLRRGIVIEQLIKLFSRLHLFQPIARTTFRFQIAQKFVSCFQRHPQRALRKNQHPVSELLQFSKIEQRTFSKLSHVREQRHVHFFCEITKL